MEDLKKVYREVACLECRGRGHPSPWPCVACLVEFADQAINEAVAAERRACAAEARKRAEGIGKKLDEDGRCVFTAETRRVAAEIADAIEARKTDKPMLQINDLDTSTRYCPCGSSVMPRDTLEELDAWMKIHRPHCNGKMLVKCSDDGARILSDKPPIREIDI